MTDAPPTASLISRGSFFWLAWLLLAISLLIPAPAGSFVGDAFGISAFYVLGKAVVWSEAIPASAGSLGFWRGAILALAMYSNVAFLYAPYLRDHRSVSATWKGFLLAALAIDASVAFIVPEFAHLPAYWIWLLSIAALAIAFVAFPGDGATQGAKSRKRSTAIDNGDIPPFLWVLLGFTLFWVAVSAGNYASPPQDSAAAPANAPLTNFLTDRANLLTPDEATRLGEALQKFEKATSNQIAVAIYRRAPGGSIEDFTIRIADRSRLGRKGLDNGAILFVFVEERVARLEVGYGLEGTLTDVQAHRILDADLVPAFARGAYFDGLDVTLGAIFDLVHDAYERGRMPSQLSVWWRQMKVELPKMIGNAWPVVSQLGLAARVGITFLGAFIVIALWSAVGQWIGLGGNVARGIGNLLARRPFSTGMEKVDLNEVWDSLKTFFWAIAGIVPAAGIVVLAAGGTFGGAGALIHW